MAAYRYDSNFGHVQSGTPDIKYLYIDDDSIRIRFVDNTGDYYQDTIININGFDLAISDASVGMGEYIFDDTVPHFAEIYSSVNKGPLGADAEMISSDPSIKDFAYEEYTKKSDGSWVLVNQGGGEVPDASTGLEAIDEGNGIGWRLIGRNPDNFGDIGENAIDLSQSEDSGGATGYRSFSVGFGNRAEGDGSIAMGYAVEATHNYSTAMGYRTSASDNYATAIGYKTRARGEYSTAMGSETTAEGLGSTALNYNTSANGDFSIALNSNTIAGGESSIALGYATIANGVCSLSGGKNESGDDDQAITAEGEASIAFGAAKIFTAYGTNTHTNTHTGSGSSSGSSSQYTTTSTSTYSTSEYGTIHANGDGSIAMGYAGENGNIYASDSGSIALGNGASSNGIGAAAIGLGVIAKNSGSVGLGKFNIGTDINTILEVGIGDKPGSKTGRKNAFEIFLDGTATLPDATIAEITNRGNKALITKEYVDALGSGGELVKDGLGYRISGQSVDTLGLNAVNLSNIGEATGNYSLSSGYGANASGIVAVAIGYNTIANNAAATALGNATVASGNSSTSMGNATVASENSSTSMGNATVASGISSTSMGYATVASGISSTAMGYKTQAIGNSSTAIGTLTIAGQSDQLTLGKYNDNKTDTILEVGIGNSSVKMNAFEVYTTGEVTAPSLTTAKITAGGNRTLVTKEYADALGGGGSGELIKDGLGYRISGQSVDTLGLNAVNLSTGIASGEGAFAAGKNNLATGEFGIAMGYFSRAIGRYSVGIGYQSYATGDYSTSFGNFCYSTGDSSTSFGLSNTALNEGSFTAGKWGKGTDVNTITEIGIGTGYTDRKNAFEIYLDGRIIAPELTTALIAGELSTSKVLITKEYGDANYAGGSSGELIKDGLGYRISGQSTGILGSSAVNLSQSGTATQYHSFSAGYHTNATGDYSSIAMGRMSTASSKGSIAIGYGCTSSGYFTTAIGRLITANSYATSAIGFDLESPGTMGGMAVGTRNARKADTSFEVGIGTGDLDHKNGFEVYFDGKVKAPELTTALIGAELSTSKILITKEYADENYTGGGATALATTTDITNFTNNLSSADTDVQKALDTIDDLDLSGSGLKKVPGNNSDEGWRLIEQDPAMYVPIGDLSVDFSTNWTSNPGGASGFYATCLAGYNLKSEGNYSLTNGYKSVASGDNSISLGYNTRAINDYQTVLGRNNIGVSTSTIFEMGNGISDANKMNAFEIYLTGEIVAPELTTALIDAEATGKVLVTKEYADIKYSAGTSDHTQLSNIGTNTHISIDNHITDMTTSNTLTGEEI